MKIFADKNPDKLSHLRYKIEVVEKERLRSNQFFIKSCALYFNESFSRTELSNPVFLVGWGGGGGGVSPTRF